MEGDPIELSWMVLVRRIGDMSPEFCGSTDVKKDVESCCAKLSKEYGKSKADICKVIILCVELFPHKVPYYSLLVGFLSSKHDGFGGQIVDATQVRLQEALGNVNFDRIRILLRFLSGMMCSKVVAPNHIIKTYEALLLRAKDILDRALESPGVQLFSDFHVYCILASLPWGGPELFKKVSPEFIRVLDGIHSYIKRRRQFDVTVFSVFKTDEGNSSQKQDFIQGLWESIEALHCNQWKVKSVPQPYLQCPDELTAEPYTSRPISFAHLASSESAPEIVKARENKKLNLQYFGRLLRLQLVPNHSDELRRLEPVDRFVIEEYVLDLLSSCSNCERYEEHVYFLGKLPVSFMTSNLAANTLFAQLLSLPYQPDLNHCGLFISKMCQASQVASLSVASLVGVLLRKIGYMDTECRTILILWFSNHLSTVECHWPWQQLAFVKNLLEWSPPVVFLKELFVRTIRKEVSADKIVMFNFQKISESELEYLLPGANDLTVGNYKYFSRLVERIAAHEDIGPLVKEIVTEYDVAMTIQLVCQAMINEGSGKSEKLVKILENYRDAISELCPDEKTQLLLMSAVSDCWKNSSHMISTAIDMMMSHQLVSTSAIIRWVFSDDIVTQFHLCHLPLQILWKAVYEKCTPKETGLSAKSTKEKKKKKKELITSVFNNFFRVVEKCLLDFSSDEDVLAINGAHSSSVHEWRSCTLGHLKSFSRQYGAEIFRDIESFSKAFPNIHPLISNSVLSGLKQRSLNFEIQQNKQEVNNTLKRKGLVLEKPAKKLKSGEPLENKFDAHEFGDHQLRTNIERHVRGCIKYNEDDRRLRNEVLEKYRAGNFIIVSAQDAHTVISKIDGIVKIDGSGKSYLSVPSRAKANLKYCGEASRTFLYRKDIKRTLDKNPGMKTKVILDLIHYALTRGIHLTKREVFYHNAALFGSQAVSDRIIEDIACMLGCTRGSLNVIAAKRGVVAGDLSYLEEGEEVNCLRLGMNGRSITPFMERISHIRSKAQFILLIEKGATFQRIAEDRFFERFPCILITANGMPDIAARTFLKRLEKELSIPVIALMDCDPSGMKILSVYASGSKRMSYDSEGLSTPNIKWLGVLPKDLDEYGVPRNCLLSLTDEDREDISALLADEDFIRNHLEWATELKNMLTAGVKAEIQALCSSNLRYLTDFYLPHKLSLGDWVPEGPGVKILGSGS